MFYSRRVARGAFFLAAGGALCLLSLLGLTSPSSPPRPSPPSRRGPFVSLSSTPSRLNTTLPLTLHSLTIQSLPPSSINVFLPPSAAVVFDSLKASESLPSIFKHPLIRIKVVRDRGPATKLLPALEELLERAKGGDAKALEEHVVVVDDDHAYSTRLLETLVEGHETLREEKAECANWGCVVALRGWRVRRSLEWGVAPEDVWRHVIEGGKIKEAYRVAVVTANEGYLVLPRFFIQDAVETDAPDSVPVFDYSTAPPAARFVDDVWISHHLSLSNTPRFIIPLPPSSPSLDLTDLFSSNHPLESRMSEAGIERDAANTVVLQWGRDTWEAEEESLRAVGGDNAWWDEEPAGKEPRWLGWWAAGERMLGRWRLQWSMRRRGLT